MLLTGEYEHVLDTKNRLSIPSRIREAIDPRDDGDKFYVVFGPDKLLCLYPSRYYEQMAANMTRTPLPLAESLAYDRLAFGLASLVEPDRQGRILLPERMVRRAGLDREVVLVGVRDHVQVWNRPAWEEFVESSFANYGQIREKAREAKSQEQSMWSAGERQ